MKKDEKFRVNDFVFVKLGFVKSFLLKCQGNKERNPEESYTKKSNFVDGGGRTKTLFCKIIHKVLAKIYGNKFSCK